MNKEQQPSWRLRRGTTQSGTAARANELETGFHVLHDRRTLLEVDVLDDDGQGLRYAAAQVG